MTVVVGHVDAIEREVGLLSQEGCGKEESATEALELSGSDLTLVVGIGLIELLGEIHGVVDRAYIGESAIEHPAGSINPTLAIETGIGACLIVRGGDNEGLRNRVCGGGHLS